MPKSLNVKLRSHYFKNNKENKVWDLIIGMEVRGNKPESPLESASLTIIRHSYRMLDYDGLVGSMKPVVDSLVSNGIIKDDSWNVLGAWNVSQQFRSKKLGPLLYINVKNFPKN
jgi:hypothetical protein